MNWLACLALVVLGADAPKGEMRLLDRSGAFSYVLPNGWHVQHREGLQHDYILLPASGSVNRNINIADLPGSDSLESLKQEFEREFPQVLKDFQLISSEIIEREGKPYALKMVMTSTFGQNEVRQILFAFQLGETLVQATCSVAKDDEAKHDRRFEAFVGSMSKPKDLAGLVSSEKVAPIVSTGAAFFEPAGWTRLKPDKTKTKGWFIAPKSFFQSPDAMIMVDIGKPSLGDARKTAEQMAKQWGGRVLEEKTSLDGVEALRIRVDKPGQGLRPVEGVMAVRNEHLYLLMGGATPGKDVSNQVEEVMKRWKWVD